MKSDGLHRSFTDRLRGGVMFAALISIVGAGPAIATCVVPAPTEDLHTNYSLVDREGTTRQYDLYVSSTYSETSDDGALPRPLIVDLHGLNATKENQELLSGFMVKADEQGFIVVYPQGRDNSWNGYNCCGPSHQNGYDDVGYLRDLVADVSSKVNVDHRRIYITGISTGAAMTHRLACEAADLFAAAATFSMDLALPDVAEGITTCNPVRPIAMSIFRGYREGNLVISSYCPSTIWDPPFPGAQAGFVEWAGINGCTGSATETDWSPSGTQVSCYPPSVNNVTQTYESCDDGVHVKLTSWDAGHVTIYAFADGASKAWDHTLSQFTLPGLPDQDGDGIADVDDNCPALANPDQLDSDADCEGDACEPCPAVPAFGCRTAQKSLLQLKDDAYDTRDKLTWKWLKGQATSQPELGDPTTTADYDLCVYDAGGLLFEARVPADAAKWSALGGKGYKYSDGGGSAQGVTKLLLGASTENNAKVVLKGKGANLPDPTLGSLPLPVTVQLQNEDSGLCLEAVYDAAHVIENGALQFKGKVP
jgi:polyhydroxybutyrate depolymerase